MKISDYHFLFLSILDITYDPCDCNPCLNGGSCESDPDTFVYECICQDAYGGTHCQQGKIIVGDHDHELVMKVSGGGYVVNMGVVVGGGLSGDWVVHGGLFVCLNKCSLRVRRHTWVLMGPGFESLY